MTITSVVSDISMQSLVLDRVCAIGEFICDTPVIRGKRTVTMATNFGTKIAINAHKCISTRDNENVITYNRVFFRGGPIQRRLLSLQGSKGRCHGNQMLANVGQKITKMAITSVVCNIPMQNLVLRQGLRYRVIHL